MNNDFDKTAASAYVEYKRNERLNREQQISFEEFKQEMRKEVERTIQKSLKAFEKNFKKK